MSKKVPFGKLSTRMLQFWVEADLTAREWLVFMALHSFACWEGKVFQTQAKMAKSIRMDASNFGKAVKKLESVGAIARHGEFIQISHLLIEYGDWAGAKEIAERKDRKQRCVAEQQNPGESEQSGGSLQSAAGFGQKPQGQLVSFPSKQRSDDSAGG